MSARLTAEAFIDLQRRAERIGLTLRRTESEGQTRIFVNGRELLNLDDIEAVVTAVAVPRHDPLELMH